MKNRSRTAPRAAFFHPLGLREDSPIRESAVTNSMATSANRKRRFQLIIGPSDGASTNRPMDRTQILAK